MHWFASIEDAQAKIDAWRWHALIEKKLAIEDEWGIFPGGARAVLLTGKAPYRALGIPDVRHRRGKDATTQVLMRRMLCSITSSSDRPSDGSRRRRTKCTGSRRLVERKMLRRAIHDEYALVVTCGFLRTSDYWRIAPVSVRRARKVQTISRPSCGLSVVEAEKSAEAALCIIDRRLRGSLGTHRKCCTGCVATSASGGW